MSTLIKVAHMQEAIEISSMKLKVSPYSFLSVRADFENLVMRKRSNSTPKLRARSRRKMLTNMASKLLKFGYQRCCVDRLRF